MKYFCQGCANIVDAEPGLELCLCGHDVVLPQGAIKQFISANKDFRSKVYWANILSKMMED